MYLPFVLNLQQGLNRFEINQHTGSLFFRDVDGMELEVCAPGDE